MHINQSTVLLGQFLFVRLVTGHQRSKSEQAQLLEFASREFQWLPAPLSFSVFMWTGPLPTEVLGSHPRGSLSCLRLVWLVSNSPYPSPHLPPKFNLLKSIFMQCGTSLLQRQPWSLVVQPGAWGAAARKLVLLVNLLSKNIKPQPAFPLGKTKELPELLSCAQRRMGTYKVCRGECARENSLPPEV